MNIDPDPLIDSALASKWHMLRDVCILKKIRRVKYLVNLEKLAHVSTEQILGVRVDSFGTCDESVAYMDKIVSKERLNPLILRIFWSLDNSDALIDCITDVTEEFVAPVVLMPRPLIEEMNKEYREVVKRLRRKILDNPRILILFPVILPFPSNKKDLSKYTHVLKELQNLLNEVPSSILYSDEYGYLAAQRYVSIKVLVPFAYLYTLLEEHAVAEMKEREGRWKKPYTWFEEIVKLLLMNTYVRGSFSEVVVNYIVEKYETGGPCEEDIAIPIKLNKKASMVIVDTKLRAVDISEELLRNTLKVLGEVEDARQRYVCGEPGEYVWPDDHLFKYEWYVKSKSDKLEQLEELVSREARIVDYYLVFIQRVEPNTDNVERLNQLKQHYREIKILSLKGLTDRLINNHLLINLNQPGDNR